MSWGWNGKSGSLRQQTRMRLSLPRKENRLYSFDIVAFPGWIVVRRSAVSGSRISVASVLTMVKVNDRLPTEEESHARESEGGPNDSRARCARDRRLVRVHRLH